MRPRLDTDANGDESVTWVDQRGRPIDPATVPAERRALIAQAAAAFRANRQYLALSPPTQAQVAAQVAALTRQMQGVLRLAAEWVDQGPQSAPDGAPAPAPWRPRYPGERAP